MKFNKNFIVEISEPSEEDVQMKVWRSIDGEKANPDVHDTYNIKRQAGESAEAVCKVAAPHLFE